MAQTTSTNNRDAVFDLLKPLTAVAAKLFAQRRILDPDDMLPATGKSARDLAFDVCGKFYETGMGFRPKSPETYQRDLFSFLKTALRNDFFDLVKKLEYKNTDVIDLAPSEGPGETNAVLNSLKGTGTEDLFRTLDAAMLERRIMPLVEDDPDLKELVEAIICFPVMKRADIASLLDITPQEVTYRRNRLRIRLASWKRLLDSRKTVMARG